MNKTPDIQIKSHYYEATTKADKSRKSMVSTVSRANLALFILYVLSIALHRTDECQQKYGSATVWKACCSVFDYLNLAAVSITTASSLIVRTTHALQIIDGEVLCVHGGLSPDIRTLDQIRVLSRSQEIPHEGAFCGMERLRVIRLLHTLIWRFRFDVVRPRRHRELGCEPSRCRLVIWRECDTRSACNFPDTLGNNSLIPPFPSSTTSTPLHSSPAPTNSSKKGTNTCSTRNSSLSGRHRIIATGAGTWRRY
jgi:diadenosine tetraphosphatase ApaH/serine/threonine PP2A family protein phosphatase